ncbi:3-deoxy-manno-octulosonate cytidylyltransferase [Aliarcobacter butzleri]|uniref:3-deoxy-manno-octulosonate cytidylyltransferase n=1 Tax=Aliarcobacter butzleri TaxID=28197 RepID=UPI003B21ED88
MVNILDCTLRDGGYINDWSFKDEHTLKILKALNNSKIDIIECGYLNNKKGLQKNSTLFDSIHTANKILESLAQSDSQNVVMINFGDFDIKNLPPKNETLIDGIRLAFHKKNLDEALKSAKQIITLGYKLYFQPMITKNYKDIEFLSVIEKINEIKPYAFYIVDSFGSMTLKEFNKYLILADTNLSKNISLGYHSHNNMQLAFSNAISMCYHVQKREIIIDSSIYGIGRGAGNLNTELIADYLNSSHEKSYDTLPLLEIIDELLASLMAKNSWGFSPAQFLSSSYNCHPNYVSYLVNKNTNYIVSIKKILDNLPEENKSSFDKELIEKLYREYILEPKSNIKGELKLSHDKNILLIASGKSINDYKSFLELKVKDTNYQLIGLNHKSSIGCDYYFFTNQKRYDEFYERIEHSKIIVTNNIQIKNDVLAIIDYKKLAFVNGKFISNVTISFINYLINTGFNKVAIAGLDGYKENINNYNYEETSVVNDNKTLQEQNNILEETINILKEKISIEFLTPSIFEKKEKLKILGIIPARYKSSRFEGKPLCIISGIPMVKRTYLQAKKSNLLDDLIVATESEKIKEYCESENIPVIMTSDRCLTGTDRLTEVSKQMNYDLYVNIQGDEPVIDSNSIDEVVSEYKNYKDDYIAYNLYKTIDNKEEVTTDTIIKVITNEKDELMYMSRLGIPFNKSNLETKYKKQICVYGFTKKALELFSSRSKTQNEQFEDIEILRFVDMGYKVKMKETTVDSIAVDIPNDVEKVEKYLEQKGLK